MATILTVEDDKTTRDMIVLTLVKAGHTVLSAADGEEAMAIKKTPDLAIIDNFLPDISGIEVAKHFRSLNIPFIFCSSATEMNIVQLALRTGALGYISKPFSKDQITIAIESALKRNEDIGLLKKQVKENQYINTAIGLLMERLGLGEKEALGKMRSYSEENKTSLVHVAEDMIEAAKMLSVS